LTLAAPIGPVNVEIIKRGLNAGFRQAFLTGTGAMCADATYLTLIFFGLTAFLKNAFIAGFLGITGSFILIYLGAMSIREYFKKESAPAVGVRRVFKYSFVAGYALAISSPMTIVWWTGVFGALMASQGPVKTSFSAFFVLPVDFTGLLSVGILAGRCPALGKENHQRTNHPADLHDRRHVPGGIRPLFSVSITHHHSNVKSVNGE